MVKYVQEHRRIGISTSLGDNILLLTQFEGEEPICGLFNYRLNLLSENDSINAREIIGKAVLFWIEQPDGQPRFFHGMVSRFEYIGKGDRLSLYRAQVVPSLWFLSLNSDCRIFQKMTVKDIISEVLKRRGVTDFDLSGIRGSYPELEYCVQYNESDFAFVSRLMEGAGIHYYFQHSPDGHRMILGDSNSSFKPAKDAEVGFADNLSERSLNNSVWKWEHTYEFRPGKWAHKDFNFQIPLNDMLATANSKVRLPNNSAIEVYEYPGGFEVRDDGGSLAKVRMEAEEAHFDIVQGQSYCRSFSPGLTFKMKGHHSETESNREYVITAVRHRMDATGEFVTGGTSVIEGYENEFTCVPSSVAYRPLRKTNLPRVYGTQTAMVVGPKGEEIYTDEFGRVKVQFHWDREGKFDENSSCWLRVSQIHAGAGWGMMDLPRIGEEVIVSFLEGDPDRPLIVGRVYNGVNKVPFNLPAEKTRRGNTTKTYKGAGHNEMSMDDTPGKEQLRMNAQYDMNSNVNHDQTETVGNDRTRTVGNNEGVSVGVDRTVKVGSNHKENVGASQTVEVGANQSVKIGGSQTLSVGGSQSNTIATSQSNSIGTTKNETVGMASNEMVGMFKTVNVGVALNTLVGALSAEEVAGTKVIIAGVSLAIQCGASSLTMDAGGKIVLKGTNILIDSSGPTKINGGPIDLN
ncbi:MAG: type VI secretion system tip protein TssI/VgrG [Planctomycetaceae bacterium]